MVNFIEIQRTNLPVAVGRMFLARNIEGEDKGCQKMVVIALLEFLWWCQW